MSEFAIFARAPDYALIALGKRLDAETAQWRTLQAEQDKIVSRARTAVGKGKPLTVRQHEKVTAMLDADARYCGLCAAQDPLLPDELFYSIGATYAHGLNGYFAKARALAWTHSDIWNEPLRDLDFGPKNLRMFVESVFAAAGPKSVEKYLDRKRR